MKKFDPGTAVVATSTVEISISCRNLLDKDVLSKSDPMTVIYHRPPGTNHWVELMRTETIQNNLNPDFATKVTVEYRFEEQQLMRFEVYDIDKLGGKLSDQDFLGFVECTLAQIVSGGAGGLEQPLTLSYVSNVGRKSSSGGVKSYGSIILLAEELASLKDEVTFKFGGNSMGGFSFCIFPPKLFYVLSKVNEGGAFTVVHRSGVSQGTEPNWGAATVSIRSLCNGDRDRGLKIECFREKRSGSHKSLGYIFTTLNKIVSLGTGGIKLLSSIDQKETSAVLLIIYCKISPIYTFLDYIQHGTQIHCCFGIDFTASNGDPSDPTSLHYFSQSLDTPNPYEQAIQCVGDIIQDYDMTKMFPVIGFGARIPPHGGVSHNFFVTLTESSQCLGVHGVMEAYRNCIRQVQLYGPTNFAPIINHAAQVASQNRNGEHYYVLLIITDGVITDMPHTKEAIVNAAELPLSIIIVGVGGADFDAMEELDGDSVRISFNGRQAARDIVQFVPYRDAFSWMASTVGPGLGGATQSRQGAYAPNPQLNLNTATHRMAQVKLAQEVLAEIPQQLTSYMKSKGLFPQQKPNSAQPRLSVKCPS